MSYFIRTLYDNLFRVYSLYLERLSIDISDENLSAAKSYACKHYGLLRGFKGQFSHFCRLFGYSVRKDEFIFQPFFFCSLINSSKVKFYQVLSQNTCKKSFIAVHAVKCVVKATAPAHLYFKIFRSAVENGSGYGTYSVGPHSIGAGRPLCNRCQHIVKYRWIKHEFFSFCFISPSLIYNKYKAIFMPITHKNTGLLSRCIVYTYFLIYFRAFFSRRLTCA